MTGPPEIGERRPAPDRLAQLASALLVVGAVALSSQFARGAAARWSYPFDLEWMEGGMLAHAWRVSHGLPLYPEPGPEWIPFVYPPGYPALLAALSVVAPLDYGLGRAVSIVATFVAAAGVGTLVGRRGSPVAGVVVAALFLGLWRASGAFYDLVRPDALSAALVAWTLVAAGERSRRAPEIAGALLFAAFVVKQHSAALGVPLALGLWMRDGWRVALRFAVASAGPALVTLGVLELATAGRFLAYVVQVPASHPQVWDRVMPGTPGELGVWLLPAMVVGAVWLCATGPAARDGVSRVVLLALPLVLGCVFAGIVWVDPEVAGVALPPLPALLVAGGTIGAGLGAGLANGVGWVVTRGSRAPDAADARWWLGFGVTGTALVLGGVMRGHNGGFMNVLMPVHLVICAGFGLVVVDLMRRGPGWGLAARALLGVQLVVVGAQLKVDEVLPTEADVRGGQQVLERLAACPPGPIFSPFAAWLPVQVGREPSVHLITLWDLNHERGPFQRELRTVNAASRAHRWSCVVQGGRERLGFGIEEAYQVDTTFRFEQKQMMAKTGWRVRPTSVLVPRAPGEGR